MSRRSGRRYQWDLVGQNGLLWDLGLDAGDVGDADAADAKIREAEDTFHLERTDFHKKERLPPDQGCQVLVEGSCSSQTQTTTYTGTCGKENVGS